MLRVILTHLYVIVVALIVLTASQIIASRYGDDIVTVIEGMFSSAESDLTKAQESVKDWNKNILD